MLDVMIRCAIMPLVLSLSAVACSGPASPAASPSAESANDPIAPGATEPAAEEPASAEPGDPTAPGASDPGGAPRGKRAPCQSDQACNDDPSVSALWGRCTELGVCECNAGFERSPITDLCRPVAH